MDESEYGWIIDKDHVTREDERVGLEVARNDVGTLGPFGIAKKFDTQLRLTGEGQKFKMYDDDGTLYYEGRIVGDYDGFEPLDDFGTPNAGCTYIELQNEDGAFERL